MYIAPQSAIGQLLHRLTVRRWRRVEAAADTTPLPRLAQQKRLADRLMRPLRRFGAVADLRLAAPITEPAPPTGTDWAWRPRPWRERQLPVGLAPAKNAQTFSPDIAVFHDCNAAQVTLRQIRNSQAAATAPFGLMLDVLEFTGSFLSLVVEVPPRASEGLQKRHIIRLAADVHSDSGAVLNARLNLRNGPNVEQIMRPFSVNAGLTDVGFDLAYTQLNEKRASGMWIDLLIADPAMRDIHIRDLSVVRYPRADVG
ncbi:MAG: DUF6478 family protein [Pseudomonadota bacterium]